MGLQWTLRGYVRSRVVEEPLLLNQKFLSFPSEGADRKKLPERSSGSQTPTSSQIPK